MKYSTQKPIGNQIFIGGKPYDYFAGCGYLGLQNHPEVLAAARQMIDEYGLSTATSRGGFGEHPLYDELEKQACAFFDCEKALYFASGYFGMNILLQGGSRANEHLFIDAHGHYSLWDAARASGLPVTVFRHANLERLRELLKNELRAGERPVIMSDGVFPVSGELAPVPAMLNLIKDYDGMLYLDDAHAVGVLGSNGRGTLEHYGIANPCCQACGTLSKALGGWGGILWGEKKRMDKLDRRSGVMAGSSPPPLVTAAASARALELARTQPQLRQRLWENVHLVRQGLNELGWALEDSPVPILCLKARDGINLNQLRDGLFARGIGVEVVRSYTSAPPGGALRIAIFASHTHEQIERLLVEMRRLIA